MLSCKLNVIDDYDGIVVAQKIAQSMSANRVIRFLEEVIWKKGKPDSSHCDKGPEFISHEFQEWYKGNGINIMFTLPARPTQNSNIKRFNGSYRRAVLDAYIFRTLEEVREVTDNWMNYYLQQRKSARLTKQLTSDAISIGKDKVILYTLNRS